jgi:dTDP-4-dehydrorhamnose 3,5-epimerase
MDKVILTPLKQIFHAKGNIFHALKKSEVGFNGFGEAYFSMIDKGTIKGWKKHTEMIMNLVVPLGIVQLVIYDEYKEEFFSVELSQDNYQRLTVLPNLWMAFRGIGDYNMLLNIASIEHNPNESINTNIESIKYEW